MVTTAADAAPSRPRAASPAPRKAEKGANDKNAPPVAKKVSKSAKAKLKPTVLSPEGLQHIADHKYVPGKYTPLDNVLNPYWTQMAEALPTWLAPNLVTLLGFLPMVTNYIAVWYELAGYGTAPSRLLAIFSFLALFFYQTMDALDGKQARRTGSSSPLGQLFDHGCDCLACLSHHSMGCMLMLPGNSRWGLAGLAALQGGFFLAQWQEYHTGVLQTSFGPVGVTETQFVLMGMGLFCGIAGPEFIQYWSEYEVQSFMGGQQPVAMGLQLCQGWSFFCGIMCVISLYKTLSAAIEKGAFLKALQQLVSVILLLILMCFWEPSVYVANARKVVFISGLVFFFYTSKMILFSMAKMHYPTFHLDTLVPYAALVALSWVVSPSQFSHVLTVGTVLLGLRVAVWLMAVLDELQNKLQIYAFTLRKRD